MSAIDAQDYDLAAWLMAQGASVTFVAQRYDHCLEPSSFISPNIAPGTPTYQKVLALKEAAEQRGAQFPAKSPKQRREERKAASGV